MTRFAALLAALVVAAPLRAETIVGASYEDPTERYAHGILGDRIEWGSLKITVEGAGGRKVIRLSLPLERVFEDVAPRLADVTGDGAPEVVVVETHVDLGAQLAIYDAGGKLAATPHIGRSNRWLAPVGIADLDGDGLVEIAYIDRPHLAKTLRVWRFAAGELRHVADLGGLTNHRIGERDIGGGIRDCGDGPEMITASADWTKLMATRLRNDLLQTRVIGTHRGRSSLNDALDCK